jgi:hypothetical protein
MKIYRVSLYSDDQGEHIGYAFYTNRRDAEKMCSTDRDECEEYDIRVPVSGKRLALILDSFGSHPDNG